MTAMTAYPASFWWRRACLSVMFDRPVVHPADVGPGDAPRRAAALCLTDSCTGDSDPYWGKVARDTTAAVGCAAARRPNLPSRVFDKLASSRHTQVRKALARADVRTADELTRLERAWSTDGKLPSDALTALAGSRAWLAAHQPFPGGVPAGGPLEPNTAAALLHEGFGCREHLPSGDMVHLFAAWALNPSADPVTVAAFADRLGPWATRMLSPYLAANERVPQAVLRRVHKLTGEHRILQELAGNPNTPPELLAKMASRFDAERWEHQDVYTASCALANPSLPAGDVARHYDQTLTLLSSGAGNVGPAPILRNPAVTFVDALAAVEAIPAAVRSSDVMIWAARLAFSNPNFAPATLAAYANSDSALAPAAVIAALRRHVWVGASQAWSTGRPDQRMGIRYLDVAEPPAGAPELVTGDFAAAMQLALVLPPAQMLEAAALI